MLAACGGSKSPASPTPVINPTLTAPALGTPADNEQLDTLRPTLSVKNGTSTVASGARTYEFQIADNSEFVVSLGASVHFAALVSKTGVPEGANGTTSFTVDADLQPTTKFYWRVRLSQGNTVSEWSANVVSGQPAGLWRRFSVKRPKSGPLSRSTGANT